MILSSPPYVLVDTSFLFALLDPSDGRHAHAQENQEWIDEFSVVLPWPILYETMNTRLARRKAQLAKLDAIVRRRSTERLDDSPYRIECYEKVSESSNRPGLGMSLVDSIMLAILDDRNVRIDAVLSFNDRDFRQFCRERNIAYLQE